MQILFTTLEQWLWHLWDNLFRLIAWNFAVAVLLLPSQFLPLPVFIAAAVLAIGPLFTGTVSWAWPMADDRSPDAVDLLRRIGRCWPRAAVIHALFATAVALLQLNLGFYLGERGQQVFGHIGGLFLAGTSLWVGAFVLILWMWSQVAIAEDREQGPHSVRGALRQALRIFFFHPLLSTAHAAILGVLTWLAWRTQVAVLIGWFSFSAAYLATAVYEMYYAAEAKAEAAREAQEAAEKRPTSWREIMQDDAPGAHPGRRPRRSLREILKPWEM